MKRKPAAWFPAVKEAPPRLEALWSPGSSFTGLQQVTLRVESAAMQVRGRAPVQHAETRSRISLSGWGKEWCFYTPASGISWSRNSFWLKECNSGVTSGFSCFCALLDTCSHYETAQASGRKVESRHLCSKAQPGTPELGRPAHHSQAHHRQARENRRLSRWIQPKLPTCRTTNSINNQGLKSLICGVVYRAPTV